MQEDVLSKLSARKVTLMVLGTSSSPKSLQTFSGKPNMSIRFLHSGPSQLSMF